MKFVLSIILLIIKSFCILTFDMFSESHEKRCIENKSMRHMIKFYYINEIQTSHLN